MSDQQPEYIRTTIELNVSWRYASGDPMERFLRGIEQRRIEAIRCPKCGRRYLPPRPFCGRCKVRMDEWEPVQDTGTLVAWTVIHLPIIDGRTGEPRPSPYGMGLIQLDGADTTLNHYLDTANPDHLTIGARVRAVWRDELHGAMDDIMHFEVLP
ncbi:MAG: Zn-ribbon domain-containing OB-fold protein [Acidimicrobiia bacterium]|nr:MAG: Zn-ribbon domain-containing OB-fold protein [Acidimicrobiia bacterium]